MPKEDNNSALTNNIYVLIFYRRANAARSSDITFLLNIVLVSSGSTSSPSAGVRTKK